MGVSVWHLVRLHLCPPTDSDKWFNEVGGMSKAFEIDCPRVTLIVNPITDACWWCAH